MDLDLSKEERKFRDELRTYIDALMTDELRAELVEHMEGGGPEFRKAMKKMGEDGLLGLAWPKEYGGQERTTIEQFLFADEIQAMTDSSESPEDGGDVAWYPFDEDGGPVAPLMGDFTDYDGGFTYVEVGPSSFYLAYPDHGMMYLFIPRSAQKADMEIVWLVHEDAREGVDYDLAKLTWLWDVTSVADKLIIDQNQMGVNSRYYRPGPYGPMESQTRSFTEWYLQEIAAAYRLLLTREVVGKAVLTFDQPPANRQLMGHNT